MTEILQYIPGKSFLHQMNPVTKLVLIITLVGLSVITGSIPFLLFLILVIATGSVGSRMHREVMAQIPFLLILAVFLVILTVLTIQGGSILLYLIPPGPVLEGGLAVTSGGLALGLILALRFVVMITAFQLFIITTKPSELVTGLLIFRMPVDYILMLLIALRFIPSLQLEAKRIHEAQLSRGYNPGTGLSGKLKSLKPIMVPLVANSLAKTQVLGLTLDLRGYRSKKTLPLHTLTFRWMDYTGFMVAILIMATFAGSFILL